MADIFTKLLAAGSRSLTSARPVPGARLALVARNNEVLGEAVSDGAGHALFAPGLARGQGGTAPALVTAMGADGDYAFLDLTGPAFDLSDRGVAGRPAPAPIDAFLYTERGIYRPGETVHALTLLRDASVQAVGDVPLSLIVRRPDGVEYRRVVVSDSGLGGHHLALQLPANAMRGTWQLAAHADTGKPALTGWRVVARQGGYTRLDLFPKTGRSHQLRVHLASIGHPILGDRFYGDASLAPRMLLHAVRLEFHHPEGGARVAFTSPCPF